MTLYERFRKLDVDFDALGLAPDDAREGYFCTPKGARVIGWEGVDGIHYCFVKGFGETVFGVNPSDPAGENVHPLAENFEDLLRLLLTCGGMAAVEQAWMWNRAEFDAFLETYPPSEAQRAALEAIGNAFALTPMDDPYGYIKRVQAGFDYEKIPFSKEYHELADSAPKTDEPPERPEWKVYFANGFSSHHAGCGRAGKEIIVGKSFSWGGKIWRIPALYACAKGMVADICVEIDPAELRAFREKWAPRCESGVPLAPEEQERMDAENPMTMDYRRHRKMISF